MSRSNLRRTFFLMDFYNIAKLMIAVQWLLLAITVNNENVNINRSSRTEVFCKKSALRKFAKFTGKHRWHSLFFNKVTGLRPATLLKNRLWHRCFPVNFEKFLRTPFLKEHLQWLLLYKIFVLYSRIKCRTWYFISSSGFYICDIKSKN